MENGFYEKLGMVQIVLHQNELIFEFYSPWTFRSTSLHVWTKHIWVLLLKIPVQCLLLPFWAASSFTKCWKSTKEFNCIVLKTVSLDASTYLWLKRCLKVIASKKLGSHLGYYFSHHHDTKNNTTFWLCRAIPSELLLNPWPDSQSAIRRTLRYF